MNNLDQKLSSEEQIITKGGLPKITELISNDSLDEEKECFSEPTLKSISKLGDVLNRIDRRMKNEGFCIKYGKIVKYENSQC